MYKRGSSWYSDFWYKGERHKKSHGSVNKTVATEKDRSFRTQVASGEYVCIKNDPPFNRAMTEHLDKCRAINQESTYTAYEISSRFLIDHFGKKRISQIERNKALMESFMEKRMAEIRERQIKRGRLLEEVTYTYVNRQLSLLKAMFNNLIKAGKARFNPVSLVSMVDEIEKERILSADEFERILAAIESMDVRYGHLKDFMVMAMNTAMRKGEILKMEKAWVDFDIGIITVPRHAQKRKKKIKRVPISFAIRPILKRRMAENPDSEYVFVNPKTGTRYTKIYNSWSRVIEKAGINGKPGIDKLRFHDLRHTAATRLAQSGKDIKFIAQYLGHTDVKTSARYIHYSDEDLKSGADVLAEVTPNFTPPKDVSL